MVNTLVKYAFSEVTDPNEPASDRKLVTVELVIVEFPITELTANVLVAYVLVAKKLLVTVVVETTLLSRSAIVDVAKVTDELDKSNTPLNVLVPTTVVVPDKVVVPKLYRPP